MNVQAAILIVEVLLRYGPACARALAALFAKPAPTTEDWDAVFSLAQKSYDDYIRTNS